jgi:hypothetical protein
MIDCGCAFNARTSSAPSESLPCCNLPFTITILSLVFFLSFQEKLLTPFVTMNTISDNPISNIDNRSGGSRVPLLFWTSQIQ